MKYLLKKVKISKKDEEPRFKTYEVGREENLDFLNVLIEQMQKKIYHECAINKVVLPIVENGKGTFVELDILSQCEVLLSLIRRLNTGLQLADLKAIGGSSLAGKILTNKDISTLNLRLITSSATGLYSKEIKL